MLVVGKMIVVVCLCLCVVGWYCVVLLLCGLCWCGVLRNVARVVVCCVSVVCCFGVLCLLRCAVCCVGLVVLVFRECCC